MIAQGVERNRFQAFQRFNSTFLGQLLQWVVFGYFILAIFLLGASIYVAAKWMQRPFLGAFYEHTLVFNGTKPGSPSPEWALTNEVVLGDQLVAINDLPVRSDADVRSVLANFFPGETVTLTIRSETGQERSLATILNAFPASGRLSHFILPSALSLIFLVISLWIFGLRRNEPAGRAFSLFTSSLAIVTGAYFNVVTTHEFTIMWTLACALSGGALIDLALSFPQEPRIVINRPYLRWVGILFGLLLTLITIPNLYNFERPTAYIQNWLAIYAFIATSVIFYIGMNLYHAMYAQSPVIKTQSRTILYWGVLPMIPIGIWLAAKSIFPQINFSPILFLPIALFPLAIGYTILR